MKSIFLALVCCFVLVQGQARVSATEPGDSAQIHTTILNFYNWYAKNYQRLMNFKLYESIRTKDSPPYRINWKEAERYFNYIRTSIPQLGEEFIKNLRILMKQSDSAFKADTESDMPYNFDYDWYTNSQEEPQVLVDELKKSKQWITTVKGLDATVDVLGYYMDSGKQVETVIMCFGMKKEKGKWKIARIGCPYTTEE